MRGNHMTTTTNPRVMAGYLNMAEVCRLLGINRYALLWQSEAGFLPMPSYRIGRRTYYTPDQVDIIARKLKKDS